MNTCQLPKPLIDLSAFANAAVLETFEDTTNEDSTCNFENIDSELEPIIHSLLFSLQKLYKKYSPTKQSNDEEQLQTKLIQNDDTDELKDQHLKIKLYGALKEDWHLMEMENINKQLSNVLLAINFLSVCGEISKHSGC
ncbi:hypothetical protein EVAR_73708_1 [Eumeta japonica]|uniref:Uncharacterized protein n=1 Tax=Eumeta variegata TaxID=151549 RepID=A0A4C1TGT2_EUMVA|nr:hypothetical protein EVAR_73708_1 [Eumeta japonica]